MEGFWSGWWWPTAAAALGFVFTALLVVQWWQRRKAHQMSWAIGMLFYSMASVMEAVSDASGRWDPTVYRGCMVLAAALVGFLGLGSYYMFAKKPLGPRIYLGFLLICLALFVYGVATTPLDIGALNSMESLDGKPLGPSGTFPRIMSPLLTVSGSFFLLGGALLSIWRFARKREYVHRVWSSLLVALGTIIIAGAGGLSRIGMTAALYPAEMLASAVLFAGFIVAGTRQKGVREAVAHQRAGAEHEIEAPAAERVTSPDA